MEHKKLENTAKTLHTIAKTGGMIFQIVGIVCAVFAVLVLMLGGKLIEPGSLTRDLDFVKLHLTEEYQKLTVLRKVYTCFGLLSVSALCFTVSIGAGVLQRILAPIQAGKPFDKSISQGLSQLAWVVFGGGTIMEVLKIANRVLLMLSLPLDKILSSEAVTELDFVFSVNFNFVLVFMAIKLLAYIFDYGHSLQNQADETL
jgi:hypothetical protein